jgi:hypothetical protein
VNPREPASSQSLRHFIRLSLTLASAVIPACGPASTPEVTEAPVTGTERAALTELLQNGTFASGTVTP